MEFAVRGRALRQQIPSLKNPRMKSSVRLDTDGEEFVIEVEHPRMTKFCFRNASGHWDHDSKSRSLGMLEQIIDDEVPVVDRWPECLPITLTCGAEGSVTVLTTQGGEFKRR